MVSGKLQMYRAFLNSKVAKLLTNLLLTTCH